MSKRSRRYLILLAMLLAAAGVAQYAQIRRPGREETRGNPPLQSLVADIDTWRRTGRERRVSTAYDLRPDADLGSLPLAIGDWHGQEIEEVDPEVVRVLEPDAYLTRLYERGDGRFVWLTLIASRKGSSFHPPQICYGGWHTVVRSEPVPLARGELYVLSMVATREHETHVVYHLYLWPSRERRLEDGLVMFRITAELQGTEEETRDLIRSFTNLWFDSAAVERG